METQTPVDDVDQIDDVIGDDKLSVAVYAYYDTPEYDDYDEDEEEPSDEIRVEVEPRAGVTTGESKELQSLLQDLVEDQLHVDNIEDDEPIPTLLTIFEILRHETRRWFYWRFNFDPTGEMREEELLKDELAKRMKIREEERRKQKEEIRKQIEAEKALKKNATHAKTMHKMAQQDPKKKKKKKQSTVINSYSSYYSYYAAMKQLKQLKQERQEQQQREAVEGAFNIGKFELHEGSTRPDPERYQYNNENLLERLETCYGLKSKIFSLTYNIVTEIPSIIGKLVNLTEINMGHNKIQDFPPEFGQLVHLEKLIFPSNLIKSIDFISTLPSLTVIQLSDNQITSLPEAIGTLTNLRVLDMDKNKLKTLPLKIGELRKLDYLSLEQNQLVYVPPELGTLTNLAHLRLKNNPVRMIPPDVYQKGIEAVLKYLREYLPEMAFIDNSSLVNELSVYYNSKEFSDVTFHCKDKSFAAHRVIVAARCPSFVEQLGEQFNGMSPVSINVDYSPDVFETFLEFIYKDMDDIELEKLVKPQFLDELMSLTSFHKIDRLYSVCEQYKIHKKVIIELVPPSTFINDFVQFWQQKRTKYTDVSLQVEDQIVEAHKVILVARCEYFKSMFASGLKEAQLDVIPLQYISNPNVLVSLLEYLYTDDVENITEDVVIELMTTANSLGVKRLKGIVESVCGYSLDVDNVGCLLDVAVLHTCETLVRACMFLILREYNKVRVTEGWGELSDQAKDAVRNQAKVWGVTWDV